MEESTALILRSQFASSPCPREPQERARVRGAPGRNDTCDKSLHAELQHAQPRPEGLQKSHRILRLSYVPPPRCCHSVIHLLGLAAPGIASHTAPLEHRLQYGDLPAKEAPDACLLKYQSPRLFNLKHPFGS